MSGWHGIVVLGHRTPCHALQHNSLKQVVHTVAVSPDSVIYYRSFEKLGR